MTQLERMKASAKATYGEIARDTGLSRSHVWFVVRGQREAPADAKIIRAVLLRRISPRPSSDPEFLGRIRQVAVPFLERQLSSRVKRGISSRIVRGAH